MSHGESTPETPPKKKRGNPQNLAPAWKPGQSGNPAGRPIGIRNKFSTQFVTDIAESWKKHGAAVLEELVENDKATYMRTVCAVLPKTIELDDETKDVLAAVVGAQIDFDKIKEKLDK